MTLTVAHISPIMSVIAGLLILIMPRLLNLVVAIFLILNGLIGLGLLRWLHILALLVLIGIALFCTYLC